ncbi:hypothetical protein T12_16638 [Trichinella patagoniensis]|uniref:Uncharacterized protein n=1 Tax=Trichinella patagoniensis TaxID=990121 RepID=A0A0V0ZGU8_9BILA|nr:hypothetical protein T12_16638 [Trichinella patagoniensis]
MWSVDGQLGSHLGNMNDLPPERTDFVGPFLARDDGENLTFHKTYACIFTCIVVRAIHLELVSTICGK